MPSGKPCSWLRYLAAAEPRRKHWSSQAGGGRSCQARGPRGYRLEVLALSSRTWCVGRQTDRRLGSCVGPPVKGGRECAATNPGVHEFCLEEEEEEPGHLSRMAGAGIWRPEITCK